MAVCLIALFLMGPDDFVKMAKLAARYLREFRAFKREIRDGIEKKFDDPPAKKDGE